MFRWFAKPPKVPLYSQRFLARGSWLYLVPMAFLVGSVLYDWIMPTPSRLWMSDYALIAWAPAIVWAIVSVWYHWRLRRRLVASGWNLCPGCGYDLSAHARLPAELDGPRDPVTCPECGRACKLVRVRETWKDAYGKH